MSSPRKSIDSIESPQSPSFQRGAYPFPQYASGQRAYDTSRRGSTASTISISSVANSVGGSLDIRTPRINVPVPEAGQNAISSLLQPPILRTGLLAPSSGVSTTYKAPTSRDIPPVTLTNIPHVETSVFKDYLSRIGPLFESFQRARAENQATITSNKDTEPPQSPALSRHASTTSLLSPTESPQPRRRSSGYTRRRLNEPTPLSTIPAVYFEQNFQLENPRIFDVVSEHAEIVKPPPGSQSQDSDAPSRPVRKSLATNAILQEKLSWYMDTVEVHLINSISNASSSFFAALGSLRDLEHEASQSVERIQKLRGDLARLDQDMALGGLEVAHLRRRHENIKKLARAVDQVARVVEDAKYCESLVEKGEYDAASEHMSKLDNLISGQAEPPSPHLIDLRPIKAIQSLSEGLSHLQLRISRGFETRFLEALLSDLREHIEKVPPSDSLRRWANTFQRARGEARVPLDPPVYLNTSAELRKNLLASLNGLSDSGQTIRATTAFREAIMKEMKTLIRKHLPSSSDDDIESVTSVSTRGGRQLSQQEKSAILARNLRALDEEAAEELFVKIYTGISEALRRLSVQIKLLLDVTSSVDVRPQSSVKITVQGTDGQRSRSASLQEQVTQALDLSSLLGQAVDVAQTQITRVLKVRTEQSVRLPLQRFVRYSTLNRLFADECEAISGHSGSALKAVVAGQLTAFVHSQSDAQNQRISQTLDMDQWEAKDFDEEHEARLSRILQSMTSDPTFWLRGTRVWEDFASEQANGALGTNGIGNNKGFTNGTSATENKNATRPQTRPAYIDDTRYILVASAMTLLDPLENFLSLIASVPSIGPVVVQAIAELLRTFNSRTSQLVLGAGATRIAGLKNITTKHLALASQALSFVITLVPYMREAVRRHIGASGARAETLAEFDKVKRMYQDHQMGIHDKLVDIMTTRASSHVNAMKKIDFDAEAESEGPSPYMETLTKETATLYRVLSRHLFEADANSIVMQIFNGYKDTWTRAFTEAEVRTAGGKQRLLKDAELFDSRLGRINGFDDIGKTIIDVVQTKQITDSPASEAPPASNATTTTNNNGVTQDIKNPTEIEDKKSATTPATAMATGTYKAPEQ
ncbi:hypothetical protein AAFC00_006312 [Neodothiora populina]|uniref:Vacuolar protein sorting-associated protein 54 n=1 Tax=Neodothiora populina TaxID=2781224 RepID=A0ABR3P4W5_9PEZI